MHSTYLKNVHTLLLGNLANTCLASKRMSSTGGVFIPKLNKVEIGFDNGRKVHFTSLLMISDTLMGHSRNSR